MTEARHTIAHRTDGPLRTAPRAETPDLYGAFPRLPDAQLELLAAQGRRRPTRRGETLVVAGQPASDFLVVLRGTAAVVEEHGDDDRRVIQVHGPRRFLGEIGLGERLGGLILRAYLIRRSLPIAQDAGFRVIGSCWAAGMARFANSASTTPPHSPKRCCANGIRSPCWLVATPPGSAKQPDRPARHDRSADLLVFIGATPHTSWLTGTVATDDGGFILTGTDALDSASAAVWSWQDGGR